MEQGPTNCKGLQTIVNGTAFTVAGAKAPEFKVGLDYNTSSLKTKWLLNARSYSTEGNLTYLYKKYAFGFNIVADPVGQKVQKFDWGFNWNAAQGANFGIKHEGNSPVALGKFWVFFNHAATSSQTVGTEFAYDWATKKVGAKVGATQKFNDATSGKFKLDNEGKVDAVLKHKYNDTVTASLATGFNLMGIVAENKSKGFPVGLAFDFKF